jgi:Eukaryotic initiation factor 4E
VPEETPEPRGEVFLGSIALFRDEIEPKWEDPKNANGGRFEFMTEPIDAESLDILWETFILHLISYNSLHDIKDHVNNFKNF